MGTKKLLVWLEIGEAVEATTTAEVTTITITVEVTEETKAKVDSIVEVVVVANTVVDTKTTVEAVKEVMAVVEVVATTSGAVEAAEAMINNAGNEPVVKEAEETGGIKRIEYKSPSEKKLCHYSIPSLPGLEPITPP